MERNMVKNHRLSKLNDFFNEHSMIKKLALVIALLLLGGALFAQNHKDRWIWPDEHVEDVLFIKIGVEPKIGAGLGMASNPSFFDFSIKGGFAYQIGAALNVHVSHHPSLGLAGIGRVGLEIEALYSSQNLKVGQDNMRINCLEIPVLVQLFVTSNFQIEAGATPTMILKVSPEYLQAGNVVANVGDIRGGDVKVSVGVCYNTPFGLAIGLRYNLGMSELAENFHSKISTALFSVNYMFPLIK